jgi:hypothetical protein
VIAIPQVLALVALPLVSYGKFSIIYLVYAWGLSLSLSLTMEPWSRAGNPSSKTDIKGYTTSLLITSVGFGASCAGLAVFLDLGVLDAVACGVAPFGLLLWSGSRYRLIHLGKISFVCFAELIALGVLVFVLVSNMRSQNFGEGSTAFFVTWASPSLVLAFASLRTMSSGLGGVSHWYLSLGRDIRVLLIDSVLMDVGAIGTPLALSPVMGAPGIAVYRAIANAGFPVRILITAVRPMLHRLPVARWSSSRLHLLLFFASVFLAVVIAVSVVLAQHLLSAEVLGELTSRLWQVGIFCAGNFYSTVVYIGCRGMAPGKLLIRGRILHTGLVVILPCIGFLFYGVEGAIWGLVTSTLAICLLWGVTVVVSSRPITRIST